MEYVRAFILGSTLPISLHYFVSLYFHRQKKELNYSYHLYSMVAPTYFGIMSMLVMFLRNALGFSLEAAVAAVYLFSASFVNLLVYSTDIYELGESSIPGKGMRDYFLATFLRHGLSYLLLYSFYGLFKL